MQASEPNPWANKTVLISCKSGGVIYRGKMQLADFRAQIIRVDRHGIFLEGEVFITFSNINSISPIG